MTQADQIEPDFETQLRLRLMSADIALKEADHTKRLQDIRYAPWFLVTAGATGATAFIVAAAGLLKLAGL